MESEKQQAGFITPSVPFAERRKINMKKKTQSRVTLKMVAAKAGVSVSAVSMILNNFLRRFFGLNQRITQTFS